MTTSELPAPSLSRPSTPTSTSSYRVRLAADALAAQRLRFTVFDTECGARTPGPAGLDADPFDDLRDHLIVLIVCHYAPDTGSPGDVVATYRLLPPHANDAHPRGTGPYAGGEFDLTPLEFGTAAFLTLADLEATDARYLRFFGVPAPADLSGRA